MNTRKIVIRAGLVIIGLPVVLVLIVVADATRQMWAFFREHRLLKN